MPECRREAALKKLLVVSEKFSFLKLDCHTGFVYTWNELVAYKNLRHALGNKLEEPEFLRVYTKNGGE